MFLKMFWNVLFLRIFSFICFFVKFMFHFCLFNFSHISSTTFLFHAFVFSSLLTLFVHWCRTIYWSMGSPSSAASLKKVTPILTAINYNSFLAYSGATWSTHLSMLGFLSWSCVGSNQWEFIHAISLTWGPSFLTSHPPPCQRVFCRCPLQMSVPSGYYNLSCIFWIVMPSLVGRDYMPC